MTALEIENDNLRSHNRRLEDDLTLAKGEAHFLRIKLNGLGVCKGNCDNCKDEPCKGAV